MNTTLAAVKAQLFSRAEQSHKGTYGQVLVIAGSRGMAGAAVLVSSAALRTGCGLVTAAIPEGCNCINSTAYPEIMTMPVPETSGGSISLDAYEQLREKIVQADAVVLGPGLSQDPQTQNLVRKLLLVLTGPVVIDADALNALVGYTDILSTSPAATIITPHPGEMARLCAVSTAEVQVDRLGFAQRAACEYQCVCVLKGAGTVVVDADGQSYTNTTGNPGMATAGSGDVLSGMIASLCAQGCTPYPAAVTGVYLHGSAGDCARDEHGEAGMIAGDITEKVPLALKRFLR